MTTASTEPGSLAAAFSASPRDSISLKLAAGALGSVVAHVLFVVMFTAAWLEPRNLEEEEARKRLPPPPPPVEWVEADLGATDAAVADQNLEEKEEAQGAPAPAPPAPPAPPEPAPKAAPPSTPKPSPPKLAPSPMVENVAVKEAKKRGPAEPTDTEAAPGGMVGPIETPVGRVGTGSSPGEGSPSGTEGGPRVERAPDLAARFTKELPRWAADVPGWQTASDGFTLERTVVLRLDETGHIDRHAPVGKEGESDALLSSIQRTLQALVTPLALPDRPRGPGALTVQIRGVVHEGPPRDEGEEIALAFDYDKKLRSGKGTFTKRDGRSVLFTVKVVSVEAAEGARDAEPAPTGSSSSASPAPPPSASSPPNPTPPPPPPERVLPSNR